MTTNISFPGGTAGPLALISSAQNLTANWVDLGSELDTEGVRTIGLYLTLDINDSLNARVRLVTLHTSGGTEHVIPIRSVGTSDIAVEDEYIEFEDDADQSMMLPFEIYAVCPCVKFQVQAGTVGASAGQIDAANVTTSYY